MTPQQRILQTQMSGVLEAEKPRSRISEPGLAEGGSGAGGLGEKVNGLRSTHRQLQSTPGENSLYATA